jgi:hypothetical protein
VLNVGTTACAQAELPREVRRDLPDPNRRGQKQVELAADRQEMRKYIFVQYALVFGRLL